MIRRPRLPGKRRDTSPGDAQATPDEPDAGEPSPERSSSAPSDARGHDVEPDRLALDELRRAFERDAPPLEDRLDPPAATGNDASGDAAPVLFDIVEQDPLPASAIEAPRATIRIDDYGESTVVPPSGADPPSAAETPAHVDSADVADSASQAVDGPKTTIAIAADELPDAVYVEGTLVPDGGRTVVFIEDDDRDLITTESDRDLRRGIEPRMRERRASVKRAKSRKRLLWLLAAVLVVILGVAALALLGSSLFAVRDDQVRVTGNVYADPERLDAVIDDLVGTPVLRVDTQAAEATLEAIPWVDDAKVTVRFPHSASIEIRERQAWATYQGPDQRFRVLDREGRVLDVLDKWPFAYVLVTGPDPVDLEPGDFAPQGYRGAAELAMNLTGGVRPQVERIEVTADGSRLTLWLLDGSDVQFGEARELFAKLVRLETALRVNPDREPGTIDVSTDQTTV